jgi:transcriptional regulator with XRE-family HTH domain
VLSYAAKILTWKQQMSNIIFYSDELHKLRTDQKLKQEHLAKLIGVTRTTLSKWENAVTAPKKNQITKIASILRVKPSIISNLKSQQQNSILLNMSSVLRNKKNIIDTSMRDQAINYITKLYELSSEISSFNFILDGILKGTSNPIYVKDINNNFVITNKAFLDLFNISYEYEIINKSDFDFFNKSEAEENSKIDKSVMNSGKIFKQSKYLPNSQRKRTAFWAKAPMYDSRNNVIGVVGSFVETTELEEAKSKIEKINKHQSRIINYFKEHFPYGIIIRDWDMTTDDPVFVINQQRLDIWGVNMDIIKNTPNLWRKMIHPDDRSWVLDMHDNKKSVNGNFRITDGKGEFKWINEVTITEIDKSNRIFTISINRDITEEKEKESSLKMLKEILDNTNDMFAIIITIDRKINKVLYLSKGFTKLIAKDKKHLFSNVNKHEDIIHSDDLILYNKTRETALESGQSNCFCRINTKSDYNWFDVNFIQKIINGERILSITCYLKKSKNNATALK